MAHIKVFVVAVYCYAPAIRTYLRQEPQSYFSYAVPFLENFHFGQHCGTWIWVLSKISGCRDRPNRNFTTDVDEGKMRRHVCSKTPASSAARMMLPRCQALFCEPLPRRTSV